ncbi:MAG TPA: HAMP domain-containing sensor histidine kinase [Solirubrobacteraceae bacterium]|nr:HAMP domain-containing sensor histidine kinase [Solirubrobacteraceae bacterium]
MEWAHTLRARLIAAAGGSIVVAVALFGVATVLLVRAELRSSLDRALRQRAQDVAQLAVSAPAVLTDPGALEGPGSGRQLAVQVVDSRGRILARSLTLGAQLLPEDRLETRARINGTPGFEDITVGGRPYRVYAAPIAQAGGPAAGGAVLVASDTSDISDTLSHLGVVLALSGVGAALLAVAAAAVLTRRGLRPLRRLADAAGEIERTADPSRRLPESGVADEIGRLEGVLNRMLASLETARASERRFLADASHELRTPVTALLGNVEFAARHGADEEVLADLERDAARLARLVDDLLVLERSGAAQQELGPVDLGRLVSDVVAGRPDGRVVAGAVEPVEVQGEADALTRVLENLIENGLVHGPPDGRVTVSVRPRGDVALLTVSDEGPGPSPEQHARMFERFWRGPDSAERPGSGLGLSIVSAIVERHGGRVTVDGSAFTVELALLKRPVPKPSSPPGPALPAEQGSTHRPRA